MAGGSGGPSEKLAIFGTRRARRGAELKVMSAVEHKHPGHFISSDGRLRDPLSQPGDDEGDGWGYDTARAPPAPHLIPHTLTTLGASTRRVTRRAAALRRAAAAGQRRVQLRAGRDGHDAQEAGARRGLHP